MSTTGDVAGAPSATVALFTIDRGGIITGIEGLVSDLGIADTVIGRPWTEALTEWRPTNPTPEDLTRRPSRFSATTPNARSVIVDLSPLPSTNGPESLVAFLRPNNLAPPAARESSLTARQQQLCSLGELAAGVAHEINNALTLVSGWLTLLNDDRPQDHSRRAGLDLVLAEADHIAALTRNLLQFARSAEEELQHVNLRVILEELLSLVRYQMETSGIQLDTCPADQTPSIRGSSGRIKQAVLNLLLNARHAMPSGGKITIRLEPEPHHVRLSIEDTGSGIPENVQPQVFDPFFTTKQDGTGLGLPVTKQIVEDHGGTLHMESTPNVGTRFILRFPALTAAQEPAPV